MQKKTKCLKIKIKILSSKNATKNVVQKSCSFHNNILLLCDMRAATATTTTNRDLKNTKKNNMNNYFVDLNKMRSR